MFPHQLQDIYYAEKQLVKAPPKNDITATKPAVDCQIEYDQVASGILDLKLCPDRPDVLDRSGGPA